MAECILVKAGGGGITSDEVTATKAQVLEGKTALTSDSNDEVATGTMLSDATISSNGQMLSGVVAYGRYGSKYNGTIQSQGALAYTPSTSTQTASVSGKYMTGNITINPIPSQYKDTTGLTLNNAGQMLEGKTALGTNGTKYTGTIKTYYPLVVTPTKTQYTVTCKGMYMNDNVLVDPIPERYRMQTEYGKPLNTINNYGRSATWKMPLESNISIYNYLLIVNFYLGREVSGGPSGSYISIIQTAKMAYWTHDTRDDFSGEIYSNTASITLKKSSASTSSITYTIASDVSSSYYISADFLLVDLSRYSLGNN